MRAALGAAGAAVILLASSGVSFAASGPPAPPPRLANTSHLDRDDVLHIGIVIDSITGAWTATELATGWSSGALNAITVCASGTALALGVDVLGQKSDGAVWTTTLVAGAILTVAAVDVFQRHLAPDDSSKPVARRWIVAPTIERDGPDDRSTRVGLAVAGTW